MRFAVLASLLLTAACGHARLYDGPGRSADQVARLDISGTGHDAVFGRYCADGVDWEAWLVELDGEPLPDEPHKVEVLPGRHGLKIRWRMYGDPWNDPFVGTKTDRGVVTFEIDAAAGSFYYLDWPPHADPPMVLKKSG